MIDDTGGIANRTDGQSQTGTARPMATKPFFLTYIKQETDLHKKNWLSGHGHFANRATVRSPGPTNGCLWPTTRHGPKVPHLICFWVSPVRSSSNIITIHDRGSPDYKVLIVPWSMVLRDNFKWAGVQHPVSTVGRQMIGPCPTRPGFQGQW